MVAYRNTSQLKGALASLEPRQPLVAVDNGVETDVRRLVEAYGGRYLTAGRNVGFAAGVNLALRACEGRDVLLLNPDVQFEPGLPAALSRVLHDDPRTAAVAPQLMYPDGSPQRVAWPIPSPREAWIDALKLRRTFRPRREFLIGAVLLLRAEALADVGGFDERFFLYAEECDWQLRALQSGWRIRLADDLVAVHLGSGSSDDEGVRAQHFYRSGELFGRKWYGSRGWATMQAASLLGSTLRLGANIHRPVERARYRREIVRVVRG